MNMLPQWRQWWRLWSMRLAVLASAVASFAAAAPDIAVGAWNALPAELRAWAPAWLGPAMFAAIFLTRFMAQRPKPKKDETDDQAA